MKHRRLVDFWIAPLALALLVILPGGPVAKADDAATAAATSPDAAQKTKFIRYEEEADGAARLQAAIVTYRNADGAMVHLVSALHVGEKAYYRDLSKRFAGYDVLLYEMVKPRDMAVPQRGQQSGSAISMFQRFLKDRLNLAFQLDEIDYAAPNFVHADLDAETFFKMQEERGESMLTLMIRSMISEFSRQARGEGAPPITGFDLLAAMMSPDSARQYKLLLGRQFQDIESQLAGWDGEQGTVILTERNKAAVAALKRSLAQGNKNIGIFYGAAHMPGIERALTGDLGFKRTDIEWQTAWDMPASAQKAVAGDVSKSQGQPAGQAKEDGDDQKK